jgi:hypothetical protein
MAHLRFKKLRLVLPCPGNRDSTQPPERMSRMLAALNENMEGAAVKVEKLLKKAEKKMAKLRPKNKPKNKKSDDKKKK